MFDAAIRNGSLWASEVRDQPVHMKLLFEDPDEARYAEVYLDVDASAGRVELREKDPEYRRPFLMALGRGAR